MPRLPRTFRGRLALIAAAALAIRLFYVFVLAPDVPMAGDSQYYTAQANLIAEGKGFAEPFLQFFSGETHPSAAHPPLYPLALSASSLAGCNGVKCHRAETSIIGVACLIVLALIAARIGGERAGLIAAGIAAVHPTLVSVDGAPMSEALYGLLVATALLLALRLYERRDLASAAGLGAAIALAALTRSEALGLMPLLAWPLALRGGYRRVARVALTTLAFAAVLLPWSIRNAVRFDEPLVISHNDSTVLAGANCDAAYHGYDMGQWRLDCISERHTLDEAAQARTWRREGLDYIGDHMGRLPAVVVVRELRAWDLWQPRRQAEFAEGRTRWAANAGTVVYFLLLPVAIYGALLVGRRSRAQLLILLAPVALVFVTSAIAYGVPRFRHVAELVIVVLAAIALSSLAGRRSGSAALASPEP